MIKPSTTLYFAADSGEALPDFIQSPIPLVSDMVKKVLDVYEDDMIFRSVSLVDKSRGKIFLYHTLLLEEQEMLSDKDGILSERKREKTGAGSQKNRRAQSFSGRYKKVPQSFCQSGDCGEHIAQKSCRDYFPGSGGGVNGRTE